MSDQGGKNLKKVEIEVGNIALCLRRVRSGHGGILSMEWNFAEQKCFFFLIEFVLSDDRKCQTFGSKRLYVNWLIRERVADEPPPVLTKFSLLESIKRLSCSCIYIYI